MGAAVYDSTIGGPTTTFDPNADAPINLSLQGLFADYYFDPTEGWHVLGLVGFSAAYSSAGPIAADVVPTGPGVALGAGHEWWIGEQWSLGVMARFIYARLSVKGETHNVQVPSLQLTVTYQ